MARATNPSGSGWQTGASTETATRLCDHPDCREDGEFRAPRSRDQLRDYYWFCLEHVRAYNAAWNYYAGMDANRIETERRADTVWQRPSWPFGTARAKSRTRWRADDPFGFFTDDDLGHAAPEDGRSRHFPPGSAESRALHTLDLEGDPSFDDIRARYKDLVKRHHPDANGGSRESEERLKTINDAYMTLQRALRPRSPPEPSGSSA